MMTPERFKKWQAAQGWSNQQAADWLGLSREAVKKIRGGHTQRIAGPVVRAMQLRECLNALPGLLDAYATGGPHDIDEALKAFPEELRREIL